MQAFSGIRAIIYDLDGTLYTDTHHFDYYAARLACRLPDAAQAEFLAEYRAAAAGRRPLRIGTLYDAVRDRVLTCDLSGRATAAHRLDGTPVDPAEVAADYPGPVQTDHTTILNVGDMWWIPGALAAHFRLDPADRWAAFLETRGWMAGPEFAIRPVPGLRELLETLRGRGIVQALATNSPQPGSDALLEKAGLAGLLDPCVYEAGKPAGFGRALAAVLAAGGGLAAEQVLSVGDNFVNELAPARDLGCRTALIDPHGMGQGLPCDLRVEQVAELLPHLAAIGGP